MPDRKLNAAMMHNSQLVALHVCTSESWGGLEIYSCTLMRELSQRGCKVVVLCRRGSRIDTFLGEYDIERVYGEARSRFSLNEIFLIKKLVKQRQVGVVHVHFHRDIWAASLALRGNSDVRLFLSIYMGVGRKRDLIHRLIFGRVDRFFSSSEELNALLPQLYAVPKERVGFLPYGKKIEEYEISPEKRGQVRQRFGIASEDIVVGVVSRIDPGKGILEFVQSFLEIGERWRSKIKFLVIGDPTLKSRAGNGGSPYESRSERYYQSVRNFVRQNHLEQKVILTGFNSDLVGCLSAMDLFVFPSRDEMYSLAVLGAMCLGLPVVGADAGGTRKQIQDGVNGLLFKVGDHRDIARAITFYLEHPDKRTEHGKAGRAFVVAEHSMERTMQMLLSYYNAE